MDEESTLANELEEGTQPSQEQATTEKAGTGQTNRKGQKTTEVVIAEGGKVIPQQIEGEMTESYLDYAMSVIVARALPDVRDGLKPVQRRILYTMKQMGLSATSKHQKSAKVVGQVLGLYHPHGELAIYDAMVRLAQPWNLLLPLVDGQGNFGSMDGDSAAAMRYTEARLTAAAEALLADIDKETIDYVENYDGSNQEPKVLPARLPNILINGSTGIAVGMATNIPPHNTGEVIDALVYLIDNKDANQDELLEIIQGPDFPTAADIYNQSEIREALSTGKGRVVVRGRAEIVEERNKKRIIISQLPYQVNKATFITHIADLVKAKRVEGITDIRDESDRREGVRVVVDLKSNAAANRILNQLYEMTELQTVIHYNMVVLTDGLQPRLLSLYEILQLFLNHRQEVIRRRTEYEKKIAEARKHILAGLKIALDHLDAIIKLIRTSADRESAKVSLMEQYQLSELQANAILDMRLSQLANLEREKIYQEYEAVCALIDKLTDILAAPAKIQAIVRQELLEDKAKFAKERLTTVHPEALGQFSALDLIPDEDVLIVLTKGNYIKRVPTNTYKSQLRGGKGLIGMATREDDAVRSILRVSTHDDILLFTDHGRVLQLKAYEIPAASRQSKGVAIPNLVAIGAEEKVTTLLSLSKDEKVKYLVFASERGLVKRVERSALTNIRKSGVIAVQLKANDKLIWVGTTDGASEIAQITAKGQAIIYDENEVRPMGRSAAGVKGIRLKEGDKVIETTVINQTAKHICVVSEKGLGKRVPIGAFRHQHRAGSGVRIARLSPKTGDLVAAAVLTGQEEGLVIVSTGGQIIRLDIAGLKEQSRQAAGVILMRLNENDKVSSLALLDREENKELSEGEK